MVLRQRQGVQPELACHAFPLGMNVLRFVAIKTVKVKPVLTGNVFDRRHRRRLIRRQLPYYKSFQGSMLRRPANARAHPRPQPDLFDRRPPGAARG